MDDRAEWLWYYSTPDVIRGRLRLDYVRRFAIHQYPATLASVPPSDANEPCAVMAFTSSGAGEHVFFGTYADCCDFVEDNS